MTILRCKLSIVGNAAVGKTALVQTLRSGGQDFPKEYIPTTTCDLVVHTVRIPDTEDSVELYIHDLPGGDLFADELKDYVTDSEFIMYTYDVTSVDSFSGVNRWVQLFNESLAKGHQPVPGVLVATKTDLQERAMFAQKDGEDLARSHGLDFFETSAMKGTDVDAPFNYAAAAVHDMWAAKNAKAKGK